MKSSSFVKSWVFIINLNLQDKTGSEVDLLLKDKSLSDILFPNNLKEYPSQHSNSTNLVSTSSVSAEQKKKCDDMYERVMYEDMKSYEAPMGMGDYMMTNYKDATEFTVTSTNDEQSDMLNKCSAIEVSDVEPYEPEETEMVLAYFEGQLIDKISVLPYFLRKSLLRVFRNSNVFTKYSSLAFL